MIYQKIKYRTYLIYLLLINKYKILKKNSITMNNTFIFVDSMTQCNLKHWWIIFRHVPFPLPLPLFLSLDDGPNYYDKTPCLCKLKYRQCDNDFQCPWGKITLHMQRWTYTAESFFFFSEHTLLVKPSNQIKDNKMNIYVFRLLMRFHPFIKHAW